MTVLYLEKISEQFFPTFLSRSIPQCQVARHSPQLKKVSTLRMLENAQSIKIESLGKMKSESISQQFSTHRKRLSTLNSIVRLSLIILLRCLSHSCLFFMRDCHVHRTVSALRASTDLKALLMILHALLPLKHRPVSKQLLRLI